MACIGRECIMCKTFRRITYVHVVPYYGLLVVGEELRNKYGHKPFPFDSAISDRRRFLLQTAMSSRPSGACPGRPVRAGVGQATRTRRTSTGRG